MREKLHGASLYFGFKTSFQLLQLFRRCFVRCFAVKLQKTFCGLQLTFHRHWDDRMITESIYG